MEIVSVIITTHNRSKDLINAINSVLEQTYENIEIIVVDDFSNDNTPLVMDEYINKYQNIKYIRLNKSSGANVARNQGIKASTGRYISGLDDDDIMLPNRISKMLNHLTDEYAFVCTEVYYKFNETDLIYKHFKKNITLNEMFYYNHAGNQVLAEKSLFIEAGLFDEKIIAAQDYDMWLQLLLIKPKAYCVQEALMVIDQIESKNRITTSRNKIKGYIQVYNKYKKLYTRKHRKARLLRLLFVRNKNISLKKLWMLGTFSDPKIPISILIKIIRKKLQNA